MQVNIGEKIRDLRKKNGRTQEEMARALGVTPQAISRWEANGGYPDLGMIPAIANYFHITIDELFGYNNDRNRMIQEYNDKAQVMLNHDQDMTACIALLRRGLEEFPDNVDLRRKLALALNKQGWNYHEDKPNKYWKEAALLYEELLEQDKTCIVPLISIYSELGECEKAEKKASEQPSLDLCKEVLLGNLASIGSINCDKKAEQYRVEAVLVLLQALRKSLDESIVCNDELMNSQDGIELLLLIRQLYERIVGRNCYWFHSEFCLIDLTCVKIAGNIGDYDAAFHFFDFAFEHYTKFQQWKVGKYKKWEEQIGKVDKDLNCDEFFDTKFMRNIESAGYKIIVCEPMFFECAMQSLSEEKQRVIKENSKYSCIFNR